MAPLGIVGTFPLFRVSERDLQGKIVLRTTHTAELRLHIVIRVFTLLRTQEQGFPGASHA